MKRTLSISGMVLAISLLVSSSVWAAWSGFVSMGTTAALGDPSCAQRVSGDVVCAARSLKQTFQVNTFTGTAWSGWTSLAGNIYSAPSCTSDGNNKVFCAALSATSSLMVTVFNGTSWSTPASVGGQLTSAPSCASFSAGKLVCVARSLTGGLTWSAFNGTAWSAFGNLAATTISAPGCAGDGAGGVVCAVNSLNTTSKTQPVLANRFNGTSWQGFLNLGGVPTTDPTCTPTGISGQVMCFARGSDSALWRAEFTGGTWSLAHWLPWASLGGLVGKSDCSTVTAANVVCATVSVQDGALWTDQFNGTSWLGWTRLGGTGLGAPSCSPLISGKVLCAMLGVNNKGTSVTGP